MNQDECFLPESESLQALRQLTDQLPEAGPIGLSPLLAGVSSVRAISGEHPIVGLWKDDEVAIVTGWAAPNTVIDRHIHKVTDEIPCHEWIGIARGTMKVEFENGDEQVIKAPGIIHIPPGKAHRVTYLTYAKVWAVTMPADPAFPRPPGT